MDEKDKKGKTPNLPQVKKVELPALKGMSDGIRAALLAQGEKSGGKVFIQPKRNDVGFISNEGDSYQSLDSVLIKAVLANWTNWETNPEGGLKLKKVPADQPQPPGTDLRIEIDIQKNGQTATLSLPPVASNSFCGFMARLDRLGIDIIGSNLNIGSKLVNGRYGPLNVPTFNLAQEQTVTVNAVPQEWA